MAKDRQINGAVGIDGQVYRAGSEEAFDLALTSDAGKKLDLDALESAGHLSGYGKASGSVSGAASPAHAAKAAAAKAPKAKASPRGKR